MFCRQFVKCSGFRATAVGVTMFRPMVQHCFTDASRLFAAQQDGVKLPRKDPIFHTNTEGQLGTKKFRCLILQNTPGTVDIHQSSPYFGIPLYSCEDDDLIHMVCEIPKGTVEKMEVSFTDEQHAIVQDVTEDGKLRKYQHGPMLWNYGMLPQTYEDPQNPCPHTGLLGDGDPLDVIDLGSSSLCIGEVIKIKPLGALPLIDQGEIDWKIIGINIKDELASHIEDIRDVNEMLPGMLDEIKEWFRVYKVAESKAENKFALDGNYQDKAFAEDLIADCYENLFGLLPRLIAEQEKEQCENEKKSRKPRRPRRTNLH